MTIIVTGGSGQYARLAVRQLLDHVPAGDPVVTTRRPETLADVADRGVQVRRADFARRRPARTVRGAGYRGTRRLTRSAMPVAGTVPWRARSRGGHGPAAGIRVTAGGAEQRNLGVHRDRIAVPGPDGLLGSPVASNANHEPSAHHHESSLIELLHK